MSGAPRRAQITLTTPKNTATLQIDAQYKTTQLTALFTYVQATIEETCEDFEISPVYVFKHYKNLYDSENKLTGVELDLIDIRSTKQPHADSFFALNKTTGAISQVRRVFVNNMFFVNKFVMNEPYMPKSKLLEFSNISKVEGFQGKQTTDKPTFYYTWDTTITTDQDEIGYKLTLWNERINMFENPQCTAYRFVYDNDFMLEDPIEEPRAPVVPSRKRLPRKSSKQ